MEQLRVAEFRGKVIAGNLNRDEGLMKRPVSR